VIKTIDIQNYKSVDKLEFELGRVNVFIGENGCGKTNILEAIALAAAAAAEKLENEFLLSRGIRATEPVKMRSGFTGATATAQIQIALRGEALDDGKQIDFKAHLTHDNSAYGHWVDMSIQEALQDTRASGEATSDLDGVTHILLDSMSLPKEQLAALSIRVGNRELSDLLAMAFLAGRRDASAQELGLTNFIIYTPTEEALRDLSRESNVEPIGLHGEGLFKLLSNLTDPQVEELQKYLRLIHWFDGLQVLHGAAPSLNAINIVDQYLGEGIAKFDQRSANEGFLFLLLYAALLISSHTPKFFAIDNVDAALNPKLSAGVIKMFVEASKKHDRQVLLTTHNPGALDGLDLQDPEQRLFVVYRNIEGRTRVRRIQREAGENLPRLSEAFLQGSLGGLPNHF